MGIEQPRTISHLKLEFPLSGWTAMTMLGTCLREQFAGVALRNHEEHRHPRIVRFCQVQELNSILTGQVRHSRVVSMNSKTTHQRVR